MHFQLKMLWKCWKKIVADQQQILFVAVVDDAVVGYVHAAVVTQTICFETILILGLAVTPSYHRQGIGRHLMAEVEKQGQTRTIHVIKLTSGEERQMAHQFYDSMGFQKIKSQIKFEKKI